MATKLKPIAHEDRLSLVEHLDELRTRLIICIVAFSVCFGVAIWQNDILLDIINRPLENSAFQGGTGRGSADPFEQTAYLQQQQRKLYLQLELLGRELLDAAAFLGAALGQGRRVGLLLDTTYSGKAFAHLARTPGGPTLYWATKSSRRLALAGPAEQAEAPSLVRAWLATRLVAPRLS